MTFDWIHIVAGIVVGLIIGVSKNGVPGVMILGVTVMAIAFPAKLSVGILLPMLLIGDFFAVSYYRHKVVWRHLLSIFPWALAGLGCGYFVLDWSSNRVLELMIGLIVLLLIGLHFMKNRLNDNLETTINNASWFAAVSGFLAGFTTMVGNAAGGILAIYFLSKKLNKTHFVGTSAWFYFFVNVIKFPLYASLGLIQLPTIYFDLWMAPAILIGGLLGLYVINRLSELWFQRIILFLAVAGAIRLLIG